MDYERHPNQEQSPIEAIPFAGVAACCERGWSEEVCGGSHANYGEPFS